MSTARDTIVGLMEEAQTSWDFSSVSIRLKDVIESLYRDGTLSEPSKKPLVNAASVALKTLEERLRSPEHFQQALSTVQHRIAELPNEQLDQLATWFFRIAYAGRSLTPEMELWIRPVLARTSANSDVAKNERKFRNDFEIYKRLAEWGTDLRLSENNLNGLVSATRVVPMGARIAEELRLQCEQALIALRSRQQLSVSRLVEDSITKCREIIAPVWERASRGETCFVEQQDSRALHSCLYGLLNTVSKTEALADTAHEMTEAINLLRERFEQVRYPSSSALLARARKRIQNIEQRLATSIDFEGLRTELGMLRQQIERSTSGMPGVNWMHKDDANKAMSDARALSDRIRQREHDPEECGNELRLFEADIAVLETPGVLLAANQLRRFQRRVAPPSPLVKWIDICFASETEKTRALARLDGIRSRLQVLWTRMESQQEARANAFREQCAQLASQVRTSVRLQDTLNEIRELRRCIIEFVPAKQPEMGRLVDALSQAFKDRAADTPALQSLLQSVLDDVRRSHARILAAVDFDELDARTEAARQWLNYSPMAEADRNRVVSQIRRCFSEIRTLRFRQERAKAERESRASEHASELLEEITEAVAEAAQNPASPESWRALVNLDNRLRENWHILAEVQRLALKQAVDSGFTTIRSARIAFATEATRVFAQYNETLTDTLLALEEEGTKAGAKEAAFEAIERIKPIRTALRGEVRLLRAQRDDLYAVLTQISAAIDEVFEAADVKAMQEFGRLRADIERLEEQIKDAVNWETAAALTDAHKRLSANIRDSRLPMAARQECRAEMDRLFDEIKDRMQAFRFTRSRTEDLDAMLSRLERQGHLMFVPDVPRLA